MCRKIKIKNIIFSCFTILLCLCFDKVYAEELKDGYKIKDNVEIVSYNSSDVYVEGKKVEIENFETKVDEKNVYRKYVSLDDLIKVIPTISYNTTSDENIITVSRKYDKQINGFDVYYETEHDISKRTFTSVLFVGKDDKIEFGDETRDEVVTADADTFKIDNKLYISLRFVTEALGAEVVHRSYSGVEVLDLQEDEKEEKVDINFYSSEKYGKVIEMEWKNDSGTVVTLDNINSSLNNECFAPNFSYKFRAEGESELKSITNAYVKIYNDGFKWNINDKKLCATEGNGKDISNGTVIIKYRGVPVIIDVNNLGLSQYCSVEKLSLEENCDDMNCEANPKCGMVLGEYYCCNEGTDNSDSNNSTDETVSNENNTEKHKIMLITGHAPQGSDCGAEGEPTRTRELAQIIEKYLKKYVDVQIFNRDVMGEDINANNYSISALQYILDCSDPNGIKYSQKVCPLNNNNAQNKDYDFNGYDYALELHFNDEGGAGTFITSASTCSNSNDSSKCMQNSENADKIYKFATSIMKYMKDTGIPYNSSSNNGIRDDWYTLERYIRVSSDYKTPASLMEVCALDHDLNTYESNKENIGKSIAHGIVEALGINWQD